METKRHFIDLSPLWGKGALLSMVLSDRSDGKSTAIATKAIQEHDEHGKASVFSRRWGTEFTAGFFDEFWANVNKKAPALLRGRDFDFSKPKKNPTPTPARFWLSPVGGGDKRPAVEFIPLSMAGRYKSSLGHEKHGNIFIDEYIPLDGRYIKDEVTSILELYKTIDRAHNDTRITIAGNKITRFNPVFEYLNIKQWKNGVNLYQNGAFALLVYSSKHNKQIDEKTAFNDLVRGTAYEEYNAGEFLITFDNLVMQKHSKFCVMRISHGGKLYGLYQAGAAVVVDELAGNTTPCVCVCTETAPPSHYALWLDAAKPQRAVLERYKYNNALFFATDAIAHNLKKFYDRI